MIMLEAQRVPGSPVFFIEAMETWIPAFRAESEWRKAGPIPVTNGIQFVRDRVWHRGIDEAPEGIAWKEYPSENATREAPSLAASAMKPLAFSTLLSCP
jgi:hypothetical protein